MKRVAVLGSTGSVGRNALDLLHPRRDLFEAVLLAARCSASALAAQAAAHSRAGQRGCALALESPADAAPSELQELEEAAGRGGHRLFTGPGCILRALDATGPDLVLNAVTGAAGLPASVWAAANGRQLALANKESLVMAGPYLTALAARNAAVILPVDSEHSAVFQCVQDRPLSTVRCIYLTASGGPLVDLPSEALASVTPRQALRHPTWNMGPRITVGSATLMNKAFEVVEARWLFGLEPSQIRVVVHRQSVVHCMVEFVDGSILAQMGVPDMRVPILRALAWPDTVPLDFQPFQPERFARLTFEEVDAGRFPALSLGYKVLDMGGDAGAVLNAADEVAVDRFLIGEIPFTAIARVASEVLQRRGAREIRSLEEVYAADREARGEAAACLDSMPRCP